MTVRDAELTMIDEAIDFFREWCVKHARVGGLMAVAHHKQEVESAMRMSAWLDSLLRALREKPPCSKLIGVT